jgi:hypothetical protein
MSKAGKMHPYYAGERKPFAGSNGTKSLRSTLVEPLLPLAPHFSILNGVHMATSFDGHGQNLNYLLTGNPFGGKSFIPILNQSKETTLDAYQQGNIFVSLTNSSKTITSTPQDAKKLFSVIGQAPEINQASLLNQHLLSRFKANSTGPSLFAKSNMRSVDGFQEITKLKKQIERIEYAKGSDKLSAEQQFTQLLSKVFKARLFRSATLIIKSPNGFQIDSHSNDGAKKQTEMYKQILTQLVGILTSMKDTKYDDQRSLMDVTTFMVTSEFARTLRQIAARIDETGTDHNPLTNSVIIGGKGIKSGLLLGESDFQSPDEKLSGAHTQLDSDFLKVMGRPFDFEKYQARKDLPSTYKMNDYLNIHSVINTIYNAFDIPQNYYWKLGRNGSAAPLLKPLLQT